MLFHKLNLHSNDKPLVCYPKDNKVPTQEITESYISSNVQNVVQPKHNRRRFAPSFLLLRKKKHPSINNCDLNGIIKEEDLTEIAYYEDIVAEQELAESATGQLDDTTLNVMDLEACEREYKARMEYIMKNYRHPPPYPSKKNDKPNVISKPVTDTPLISELLKETQLKDNSSMNNYWQSSSSLHQGVPEVKKKLSFSDQLVKRTKEKIVLAHNNNVSQYLNADEVYEKKQNYTKSSFGYNDAIHKLSKDRETMSAVYADQDYKHNNCKGMGMRACSSVPNLSMQHESSLNAMLCDQRIQQKQPRGDFFKLNFY